MKECRNNKETINYFMSLLQQHNVTCEVRLRLCKDKKQDQSVQLSFLMMFNEIYAAYEFVSS